MYGLPPSVARSLARAVSKSPDRNAGPRARTRSERAWRIETRRTRQPTAVAPHAGHPRRADRFAAVVAYAAADDAVVHEVVEPRAVRVRRDFRARTPGVHRPCLVARTRQHQRHAAGQAQSGRRGDHPFGQQPFRCKERFDALAGPEPDATRPFENLSGENRIAAPDGVAHGRHGFPAPRERVGDPPVERAVALGIFPQPACLAVIPEHGMQSPGTRRARTGALKQTVQRADGPYPAHGVARLQRFVQQRRVDPPEQPQVEDQIPVVRPEIRKQTRLDPVAGQAVREAFGSLRGIPRAVAEDAQRQRPSGGPVHLRRQRAPRQRQAEEPGDIRPGEPQIAGLQDRRASVENPPGHIEAVGNPPAGEGQVQVGRPAHQQKPHNGDGIRFGQPLQFVEGENERPIQRLDGPHDCGDPVCRRGRFLPARIVQQIQTGDHACEGDVDIERGGGVVLVQRQPGDADPVIPEPSAALREQNGLAESGRGSEHRQPALRWPRPVDQFATMDIPFHALGNRHLRAQQPRKRIGEVRDVVGAHRPTATPPSFAPIMRGMEKPRCVVLPQPTWLCGVVAV